MFTGIIEDVGEITELQSDQDNVHITIRSSISKELKIDQSVSHNGICLTVIACDPVSHSVTAIKETIEKSALSGWGVGDRINLERCMTLGGRLDGHIVQGHVDTTAICKTVEEEGGSWRFTFRYSAEYRNLIISKGSVCVNGVSLTVVEPIDDLFSVAIIPYTYEHTSFQNIKPGDHVNIEFDILGKYIARHLGETVFSKKT